MRYVLMLPLVACLALVGGSTAEATAAAAGPGVHVAHERVGLSTDGRSIRATVIGEPGATHAIVVVGVIHGNETAGQPIVRRLAQVLGTAGVPEDTRVYLVDAANPDGIAAGDRHDARGVDLNRNFPWRWLPTDGDGGNATRGATYYPGPRAACEPETRAMVRFLKRVHPDVTIWYHQHMSLIDPRGHDLSIPRTDMVGRVHQ